MRARPFAVVVLLLAAAFPARAQDLWELDWEGRPLGSRSLSLGVSGGLLFSTDWNDLVVLANLDTGSRFQQVLLRQVALEPGPVAGASLTYRRGRGGARIQAGFSRSCLAVAGRCTPARAGDSPLVPRRRIDVNTYMLDVDGEIALVNPEKVRWARPYILFGLGGIVYDPDSDATQLLPMFVDAGGAPVEPRSSNLVAVNFPDGALLVTIDGIGLESVLSGVLGLGTDIQLPLGGGGLGLRLQVADHIAGSPMKVRLASVRRGRGPAFQPTTFDFGSIHNIRLTAGLHVDFGLGGRTTVAQRSGPARPGR